MSRALLRGRRGAIALVAGLVCLAGGTAAVATAGGGSPPRADPPPTSAAHHAPPRRPVLSATPIVIPPAPSTTTTVPLAPPTVTGTTVLPTGSNVPGAWSRYVKGPAPALKNAPPTTIYDPSVVATAQVHALPLYSAPGAAKASGGLKSPNYLGAVVVLLVTAAQPGWVQCYIPVRPNETTAWIPTADVSLSLVNSHIVVNLAARQLTLYRDDVPVFESPVAPGAPSSPTPTGSYFVAYIVKLTDPGDAYGPYALGTSAFSNTYFSFEGGPGQVGIHGTNQPWVIGTYASHGCVRLPNPAITTLAHEVVPGTPVEIEN